MFQIFSAYKTIWKVLKGKERFFFVCIFFLCSLRAFSYLGFAQMIACLTAKALGNQAYLFGFRLPNSLSFLAVCAVACATMAFLLIYNTLARNLMQRFSDGIAKERYREHALQEILALRKNMDLKRSNGEVIFIVESSSEAVSEYIKSININILPYIVSTVIATTYLFNINSLVGGLALVVAVLIFFVAIWRTQQDKKLYKEMDFVNSKVNNNISNCINNLPFISFTNSAVHELKILKEKHGKINKIVTKRMNIHMIYWTLLYIFEYAFMFFAVYFLISKYGFAKVGIDTIVLLVSYLDRLFSPINDMGYNLNQLVNCSTRVCRIRELSPTQDEKLDQEAKLETEKKKIHYLRSHKIHKIEMRDIEIEIGQFHKEGINATFEAGKITCICGSSGSGKTTLIGCLLGIKEYKSGKILINDIFEISSLFQLSNKINLTLQNCTIFDRSVVENIAYPNADLTAFMEKNIKKFQLSKAIERTNNSELSLSGQLSGGEMKRISFVRAASRRGDVYIFDEPTNDLDPQNVINVIQMIKKLGENDIVIVITHDKRVMNMADNVIEL